MRLVLQRVSRAEVRVAKQRIAQINEGFLILMGIHKDDDSSSIEWLADKVCGLRVFADEQGKMNRSLVDIGGNCLVVSQFTLMGNSQKGRRPSFIDSAAPEQAEPLYETFISAVQERLHQPVPSGSFGAMMEVDLVNDGPVTIVLDRGPVV